MQIDMVIFFLKLFLEPGIDKETSPTHHCNKVIILPLYGAWVNIPEKQYPATDRDGETKQKRKETEKQ